jgi:F-type H+-transporting ATPase subunit epsilon
MTFNLEIYTPHRLFFSGPVTALSAALIDGEIGVYASHSPFTAPLAPGVLKIKDQEGLWKEAFVMGGVLEVKRSHTIVMTEAAEWPEEIDTERAQKAKEEALDILKSGNFKFEIQNAREKLKRAEIRLKLSEKA